MRHYFKLPKQPNVTQYLLLFPLLGFRELKNDLIKDDIDGFTLSWFLYLLMTALWLLATGGVIYVIYTLQITLSNPIIIMLGIIFLLIGIPRIIYKLAHRKPRKSYQIPD